MKWKSYPKYKDAGIQWLGDIPDHWCVEKLKHIANVFFSSVDKHTVAGEIPVRLCNYTDVYHGDFITSSDELMEASARSDEVAKFTLRMDDVIITKDSETWDDIAIPAYVTSDLDGILCGYHLALIRPKTTRIDGRYLFRSFGSDRINFQFRTAATGITRYGLAKHSIDKSVVVLPPLREQRAIAGFLDRETGRIDALIEKKMRQIELLQEKRAALISQAVTKGLDPTVKMRDSGIEWLGPIPAHWEIARFKHVLSKPLQYGANEPGDYDAPSAPRYVRITDIDDHGALRDETFKSLPANLAKPYLLRAGDLLFARSGATVGKTFLYLESWGRAAYAGYLIRARVARGIMVAEFAAYFCRSHNYWDWLQSNFVQATIQNVNAERYGNMVLPIPPIEEQCDIVGELNVRTSQIDRLIDRVSESIGILMEYRSALISAAVTGKIDVREGVGK
jgi:type I restriction enzyme S subunit